MSAEFVQEAELASAAEPTVDPERAQSYLRQAEHDVESSRQASQTAKKALDDALQQASEARSEASATMRQLDIVRQELQAAQAQQKQLHEQREQQLMSAEADALKAEATALAAEVAQLNGKLDQQVEQIQMLNHKVMSQQKDMVNAAAQAADRIQALQVDLQAAQSAQEQVQADLQSKQEQLTRAQQASQQEAISLQQMAELTELRRQLHSLPAGRASAAHRNSGMATSPGDPEQAVLEPSAAHADDAAHSGLAVHALDA